MEPAGLLGIKCQLRKMTSALKWGFGSIILPAREMGRLRACTHVTTTVLVHSLHASLKHSIHNYVVLGRVPHGAELQYVWRDLSALSPPTGTESDVALSESILGYFLNFARSGDPNNPINHPGAEGTTSQTNLPFWPRFETNNPRGDVTMQLDVGEKLLPLLERSVAECDWWAKNDPCYIGGQTNATRAQRAYAQRLGCGTL